MSLSRRASLEARRMMHEAFMDLERVITVADRAQLKDLALDDVREAALQIERQLAASQSLRNMRRLSPLFAGLGHYSQAIEVLCNGTPYLPWIWAPIKLVLKISADYIEAFEQIIKVYSRLAEPLTRFSLLQQPFSSNLEVQKALAVYYSDILKFHGEAYNFVRRSAWQRLFATSWGRFQRRFDNIFADLKAHEKLVDKIINAANISEAKDMREKLEDWRQQEMSKFKKQEEDRTSTEFHAILSVLRVDETHQIKVFDNLTAEANQHPGSCGWILKQPKIQSWARSDRDTQFVVLHGCVGSGKSVLAAQIGTFLRSSEHSLVVAHFCTYLYPESTDYNYIMRSLMVQIIRQDPELITLSYDWLVLKKKPPNCAVIEQLLRLLVEALGTSPSQQKTLHIVFDGLDECDDSTVSSVVKTLDKLVATASSSGATILKVLLCTQMTPAVAKVVKRKRQISLSDERVHLNRAIQDCTLHRINAIRPNLSQLRITNEDITRLASQITGKADGMFLWAKLVMEFINKNFFYSREEILEAASKLPRELGKFYGRMLSQTMTNFDERSVQRISSVLSWISFAKRPLRSSELLSALAFDAGHEQVNELVPAYILDRCEPLIQKQADSSYAFLHVSVREFLQSPDSALSITETHSQRQHGLATVRCLLSCQQIFVPSYPEALRVRQLLRGTLGFHMYATQFWVEYLLENLDLDQDLFFQSDVFVLSCRLAEAFTDARQGLEGAGGDELDQRLALIRQRHYPLYMMAKALILEQNKDTLEDVPVNDGLNDHINDHAVACDLITLKGRYQAMIRRLLEYPTYPGITFQELEQFKQDFRTSAFTCRLWSCPRAVVGFNNVDCLNQHEKDHVKHVCRFPGCQYPVFSSARMLKDHVAKYHANSERRVVRNTIRKHTKRKTSPSQRQSHTADTSTRTAPRFAASDTVLVSMLDQGRAPNLWSETQAADSDTDTSKQPSGDHSFDAASPDDQLYDWGGSLAPFLLHAGRASPRSPLWLMENLSSLESSSEPPKLPSLASTLKRPSRQSALLRSHPRPPTPRHLGLAKGKFSFDNAAEERMKPEAYTTSSDQAATQHTMLRQDHPSEESHLGHRTRLASWCQSLVERLRGEHPGASISHSVLRDAYASLGCMSCAFYLQIDQEADVEYFVGHLNSNSHRENIALRRKRDLHRPAW